MLRRAWGVMKTESKKNATYPAARAEAQRQANADGFDRGLEWNSVFKTWSCKMLPGKQYRFGYETRIEVVSCENIDKCRKGHGPI